MRLITLTFITNIVFSSNTNPNKDCLPTSDPLGLKYQGKKAITKQSFPCKKWSEAGWSHVGKHNFCRNPSDSNENGPHLDGPWCFVENPSKRNVEWQACNIKVCGQEEKWVTFGANIEGPKGAPNFDLGNSQNGGQPSKKYNPSIYRKAGKAFKLRQCSSKFCYCLLDPGMRKDHTYSIPLIDYFTVTPRGTKLKFKCKHRIRTKQLYMHKCYSDRNTILANSSFYDANDGLMTLGSTDLLKNEMTCDENGDFNEYQNGVCVTKDTGKIPCKDAGNNAICKNSETGEVIGPKFVFKEKCYLKSEIEQKVEDGEIGDCFSAKLFDDYQGECDENGFYPTKEATTLMFNPGQTETTTGFGSFGDLVEF